MTFVDRLNNKPSAERWRWIVALADTPFEASTAIQKDLQAALSEVLQAYETHTAKFISHLRSGEMDKYREGDLRECADLLSVLTNGRNR